MAVDRLNVLTALNGFRDSESFAYFAPLGTAAPATADVTTLATAWEDAGIISEDGLSQTLEEETTTIGSAGAGGPARIIIGATQVNFALTFREVNPVATDVYHRQALGTTVPDATGHFTARLGPANDNGYAFLYVATDGDNTVMAYSSLVKVTTRNEKNLNRTNSLDSSVGLTAFAGPDGTSALWLYHVPNLAGGS